MKISPIVHQEQQTGFRTHPDAAYSSAAARQDIVWTNCESTEAGFRALTALVNATLAVLQVSSTLRFGNRR